MTQKVIPKEYNGIEDFKIKPHINTYNHYFSHPNEIFSHHHVEQRKNLQFFNNGVGKSQ